MKVIFIPDYSDGNPYQSDLAEGLEKLGVEISLESGEGRFPVNDALRRYKNVDILHIHWTHRFLFSTDRFRTFVRIIKFLLELVFVKIRGIKIVWTVHNLQNHEKRYPRLELLFHRILARHADGIVVHCEKAREAVIKTYKISRRIRDRVIVIPHGDFICNYTNEISRESARDILGIPENEFVYLSFGSIKKYKGITELIEAFGEIETPRVRLFVVGRCRDTGLFKSIENAAKKDRRVSIIADFIADNEIQIYMNAADVVVLPYRDILASGAAILAMSFAKPVIAPNIGCMEEQLAKNGAIFYEADSETGLINAMKNALSCDLKTMGMKNRERVKNFDWDRISRKLLGLYNRITGENGS